LVVFERRRERLGSRFARLLNRASLRYQRIADLDVVELFGTWPAASVQMVFAVLCTVVGIGLRQMIDVVWAGAGPFGLMVPSVLVATLFGRWQAGGITLVLSSLYAWYFVLPVEGSFSFALASDWPRVIVNVLAGAFVVALAELFRGIMRQALRERELLLKEIEHRVKNNFASVAAMLRLQIHQHDGNETILAALQSALGRVDSHAIVNSFLYRDTTYTGEVDLKVYLEELCASLQMSLSPDARIDLRCEAAPARMVRDRAVLMGLLVNETVTNAMKHAFAAGEAGEVVVELVENEGSWSLAVRDNGAGFAGTAGDKTLGMELIAAITRQLDATLHLESGSRGTCFRFEGKI